MAILRYWAIVEGNDREGYSAFFPDLPGCVSAGDTIEECIASAGEAAAFHLEGMAEDGEAFPAPTPAKGLPRRASTGEAARSLVAVATPGKALRVNVTIEEGLLHLIDEAAAHANSNRSAFLADAARRAIAGAMRGAKKSPARSRAAAGRRNSSAD